MRHGQTTLPVPYHHSVQEVALTVTRGRGRESVKPARKSALDRERERVPGGNHVAAVEIGILIGDETKIAVARGYTSLLKRVLQRRRFASNAEISPF